MAGSMRERPPGSGRWELRVSVGRDPRTGRYVQRSRVVHGSARQAGVEMAKLVAQASEIGANPSTVRFATLLEKWIEVRGPKWSELTLDKHRSIVEGHLKNAAVGHKQIRALKPEDFDVLYAALAKEGLGPATIQRVHSVCSSALSYAVARQWIARNTAKLAERPMLGSSLKDRRDLPELADVCKVLTSITQDSPEWGRLFWMTLVTGSRRGEMAGLQVRSVNEADGTVRIERQVVVPRRTKGAKARKEPARRVVRNVKGNRGSKGGRTWRLDAESMAILQAQIDFMRERVQSIGEELHPNAFVWSGELDGSSPWRPDELSRRWAKYRNAAGLTLRLHDLRHMTGTHLNEIGVDPATISYLIGHSRTSTTMDIYVERTSGADQRASAAWSKRLHGS